MVTRSDRSESLDVELTVDLNTQPGEVNINGVVSGRLGLGVIGGISELTGGQRDTIKVLWRPLEGVEGVQTEINQTLTDTFGEVRSTIGARPPGLPSVPSGIVPGPLNSVTEVFSGQLWTGVIGRHRFGETPIEFDRTLTFPQIRVPVVREGDLVNNLPDIPVVFEARPTEFLQGFIAGAIDDYPRVRFSIPPGTFIEEVPLSDFNCCELYGTMDELVRETRQSIAPAVRTGRTRADRVVNLANDVISASPTQVSSVSIDVPRSDILDLQFCGAGPEGSSEAGGSPGGDTTSRFITDGGELSIDRISVSDLTGLRPSRIQNWISELRDINPTTFTSEGSARSNLDSLESNLNDVELKRCRNFFGNTIQSLRSGLEEAVALEDRIRSMRSSLLDLLTQAELEILPCSQRFPDIGSDVQSVLSSSRETITDPQSLLNRTGNIRGRIRDQVDDPECADEFLSRLDQAESNLQEVNCAEVTPRVLSNRINNYEEDARSFSQADQQSRTQQRLDNLISEGRDIIDDIETTDLPQVCVRRLRSRVRQSMSQIRSAGAGAVRAVPCQDRFPQADRAVRRYERMIRTTTDPNDEEVRDILQQGERVVDVVRDRVDNRDCAEEFVDRVAEANEELRELTRRVRIRTEVPEQRTEQRQEQILQLQQQLNALVEQITGQTS